LIAPYLEHARLAQTASLVKMVALLLVTLEVAAVVVLMVSWEVTVRQEHHAQQLPMADPATMVRLPEFLAHANAPARRAIPVIIAKLP